MSSDLAAISTDDLLNMAANADSESVFADAVGELITRYKAVVYSQARYVCRGNASLADDVFQNTFLRLFEWLRKRRGKPVLHSFPALLRVFAHRAAVDMVRKEVRAEIGPSAETSPGLETVLYARQLLDTLQGAPREVVKLSFFDGLSASEIGARLKLTSGNVRVMRHRALESIRQRQAVDQLADVLDPL
jgi:RNA polymerase sigma factor (sigma-70 family)